MAGSLRGEKVAYLAEKLYNNLVDGDQSRIALSGVLSPTNPLRHKNTRERFSWVQHEFSGERLITQAMIRDAVAKMALDKSIFLVVPQTPGFSEKTWIEDQAKAIHALLKKVAGLELYAVACRLIVCFGLFTIDKAWKSTTSMQTEKSENPEDLATLICFYYYLYSHKNYIYMHV